MHVYTLHYRPDSPSPDRDVVLVNEGFCWPAFFVAAPWALWHGMWLACLLILAASLALETVLDLVGADPISAAAAGVGYSLIIAFSANDWRRARLTRRGYWWAGVVAATDRDAAMRRFFDLHPDLRPSDRPAGPPLGAL